MEDVATERTYPGTKPAWVKAWFDALVLALDARGLPLEIAMPMAKWFSVHLWREVGPGHDDAEWNFNAGNLACTGTPDPPGEPGWHGLCHRIRSGHYRAYTDRRDGAEDYVQLLTSPRYRDATEYLVDNPGDGAGWYRRLLADGYSALSESAVHEFESIGRAWWRERA